MDARRALGAAGEEAAARWYRARGYRVVARNWRCRAGELDLVAVRGRVLVVVEVKTRRTDRFGTPAEAVTPAKQRRLRRLALEFLDATEARPESLRFDVVSILDGRLEVIEAAFLSAEEGPEHEQQAGHERADDHRCIRHGGAATLVERVQAHGPVSPFGRHTGCLR